MAQPLAADSAPVDRRLWMACAPPLTRLPEVGTLAYYFPRGHAAQCDDGVAPTGAIAAEKLLCLVGAVELLVRGDEVYSRIRLLPVPKQTGDVHGHPKLPEDGVGGHGFVGDDKDDVRDDKDNDLVGSRQTVQTRGDSFVRREGEVSIDDALDAHVHRDLVVRRDGRSPVDKLLVYDCCDAFVRREGEGVLDTLVRRDEDPDSVDCRSCDADDADVHGLVRVDKIPLDDAFVRGDLHVEDPDSVDVGHAKLVRRDGRIPVLGDAFVRREAKPAVDEVGDTLVTSPKDKARRDEDPDSVDYPSCHADDAEGHSLLRVDKLPLDDAKVHIDAFVRGDLPVEDVHDTLGRRDGMVRDSLVRSNDAFVRREDVLDTLGRCDTLEGVDIPSSVPVGIPSVLLVFPKALTAHEATDTQSTFHVPKQCATGILPPMPDVAVQGKASLNISLADLGGQVFEFTHSRYVSATGRQQYQFTSGWVNFLNKKKPNEGDMILFMRSGSGLRVALQRKAMPEAFVSRDEIADAALMAQEGGAFTVTWCPRRGAEFVVPRAEVDQALSMEWTVGMRVSCPTGVVQAGLVHNELPHQLGNKKGTIVAVHARQWNKLTVHWDGEASPVLFRIFGVDIYP